MFAKATHAIALIEVPEQYHRPLMHALTEAGAHAIQIEGAHIFARCDFYCCLISDSASIFGGIGVKSFDA